MKILIFTSLLALLLSACAKNLVVSYQPESNNSGRVVLKPSKPTIKTYVSINDKLIIDKKRVKSKPINNVPIGNNIVHYTSDFWGCENELDTEFYLDMEPDGLITQSVVVPPYKPEVYVVSAFVLLVGIGEITRTMSNMQSMP
jgi:hypothetical protein